MLEEVRMQRKKKMKKYKQNMYRNINTLRKKNILFIKYGLMGYCWLNNSKEFNQISNIFNRNIKRFYRSLKMKRLKRRNNFWKFKKRIFRRTSILIRDLYLNKFSYTINFLKQVNEKLLIYVCYNAGQFKQKFLIYLLSLKLTYLKNIIKHEIFN